MNRTHHLVILSRCLTAGLIWLGLLNTAVMGQSSAQYQRLRQKMVQEAVIGSGVKDPRVLRSMRQTPRHEFVPKRFRRHAYEDASLPIGAEQTISSPFIVAYMTESLDPQPTDKVLEIGTGSGYQAAVLSPLVKAVYTIEIVESLGKTATRTLNRLGYENVQTKIGDGYLGWPEHAPFDKIIVTCSPEKAPKPLVEQLKEGGLMVIPVGQRYQQTLYLYRKIKGELKSVALRPTLFVPMTGKAETARKVQPNPTNPRVINGDFEQPPAKNGFMPGWYYQRRLTYQTAGAPHGRGFVTFDNDQPGRSAHLLQGIPLDGKAVRKIELSAMVKQQGVFFGPAREDAPALAITFYDRHRKPLDYVVVGPFFGNEPWRLEKKIIAVPPATKEAIVRIGLFGATGKISFDRVGIDVVKE